MRAFKVLRGVAAAACVAVGLLAAGCGSSETAKPKTTSPAPTPTVQTKAAYIAQADAVCKQGNAESAFFAKEVERIKDKHLGAAREAEALIPSLEKAATLERRVDAQLKALQQPPGDSVILGKIAAGHEDQAVGAERRANALRHYDASTYQALEKELADENARLFALEEGYGFKVCGG